MQCLKPKQFLFRQNSDGTKSRVSSHYLSNFDNSDFISALVPCGECYACKSNKRNAWTFRLQQELRHSDLGLFVTLTYSDDNLFVSDNHAAPNKKHCQDFLKRYRFKLDEHGVSLRYYLISEYSPAPAFRPHYHGLFFYSPFNEHIIEEVYNSDGSYYNKLLTDTWTYGITNVQYMSDANIHYCTKYSMQIFTHDVYNDCFSLMSRKPGLGVDFAYENEQISKPVVWYNNGIPGFMPRYLRDKIGLSSPGNVVDNLRDYYDVKYEHYLDTHNSHLTFTDWLKVRNSGIHDHEKMIYNRIKQNHKI